MAFTLKLHFESLLGLDAPFISVAGRLRQRFLAEMIRSPSLLSAPSPMAVFAAGWEEHLHERHLIETIYQSDDRQDRWHHFAGWRGRIELRAWLKHFDSETRTEPRQMQTSPSALFYQVPDDHFYHQPALMIF